MKQSLRSPRILILGLLCVSFIAPIVFVSFIPVDLSSSIEQKELLGETSGIVKNLSLKRSNDALKLNYVKQEIGEGLKEPTHISFKDTSGNAAGRSEMNGGEIQQHNASNSADGKPFTRALTREKIDEMEDQLIMAKAYLRFAPPNSNSHLIRELKLRIKEIDRVLGHASKDSELSRSALQRMRAMEFTLSKANKTYPDCSAMASKLRAMTYSTEEQLRTQKNQASYLVQLGARTFPKGFHCLSMRLTAEYFNLQPQIREFPNQHKVKEANLYHYAIFSDNVLACAVVVNSTVSHSMEPEKMVFHVVTNSVNYPAIMTWFLTNPPGNATIEIESLDGFKQLLPPGFESMFNQQRDPRYASPLNYLRFYLPEMFPSLTKLLLLDHDVVVQRDLSRLWTADLNGKAIAAVETCRSRLETLVDFSHPTIAKHFDPKACLWAYGMNMFDLAEWRRRNLTSVYEKWFQLGRRQQPSWKAGSLPVGQLTFYGHTMVLDRRWHLLGLGRDPSVGREEIERAAVIHYDGHCKPWLEISIPKYRVYWNKFIKYDHPYLQQCNIHP